MAPFSNNIYGSSVNKGIGGLLSGLDTDDLVKQLTAATRGKINKEYQAKQKLLYRQEAYREISAKLIAFNNKYFSYSSGSINNILSPRFFESYTFNSTSNYVNVTGRAENIQNFKINNIESVASAARFTSSKKVAPEVFSSEKITKYTSTLAGGTMTIEYEGKSYEFRFDKGFNNTDDRDEITLEKVVEQLNNQVNDFEELKDLFTFEIKTLEDGEGIGLVVKETEEGQEAEIAKEVKLTAASSSILESLKLKVGEPVNSASKIEREDLSKETVNIIFDSYITFEFNGVLKTINLSDMKKEYGDSENITSEDLASFLQNKLDKEFGEGKVNVSSDEGHLTFEASGNTDIFGISSISTGLSNFIGIESGDYNRLNRNKAIVELGLDGITKDTAVELSNGKKGFIININDTDIEIEETMSINDLINKVNSNAEAGVRIYYSSTTNSFTVTATETGSHKSINIVTGEGTLAQALFGDDYTITPGTDTILTYTLNGVTNTITRSTANFTLDEINIELNEKAAGVNDVTFDVVNNSDEVVERIKEFINEYNEIIELIGNKVKEKPKRDYPPLTPDQREELKEDEIKNWTEEAKKGALYGDSKMNNLLRNLRSAMSGFTDVSSLTLSGIGISSANMDTSGKLVVDERKLKEKLLENPDEIANLFTLAASGEDGRSGIAIQVQNILRANVGAFGTSGLLIDEAGMANSMTSDRNYISEKIKQHDDKMEVLKRSLEREQQRYWKQFSALEQSLNRLNAQSMWLMDFMGGN
ncbi:MAG TPA: flagellar filament capping protein FliD [Tissierellia bacterium]|jgi:flagellar hook-associated protein 2|nr:flagellar filament capping protein FliD [Tissierellia bacterium]